MAIDRTARLVDLRDEIAIARNLAASLYLAASNPSIGTSERSALAELSNLVREQLEAAVVTLDKLIDSRR